jgi:phage terminase small subunit
MSRPKNLPEYLRDIWDEIAKEVKPTTPESAIDAMVRQVYLLRDAERRVSSEGAVVVDARGNATEHPAIKIQRDAGKELREWLQKYGARRT